MRKPGISKWLWNLHGLYIHILYQYKIGQYWNRTKNIHFRLTNCGWQLFALLTTSVAEIWHGEQDIASFEQVGGLNSEIPRLFDDDVHTYFMSDRESVSSFKQLKAVFRVSFRGIMRFYLITHIHNTRFFLNSRTGNQSEKLRH